MKNGAMKIASASVFSEAAPSPPIWKTMRNPNAFLRKLSLNAEKNWHQNRGAKRRDDMRCIDTARTFPIGSEFPTYLSRLRARAIAVGLFSFSPLAGRRSG